LQQQQPVLVVVDLLHIQVLPRLKIHHMDVEIVFIACRKQLPQYKYFWCNRQYRPVICSAMLKDWLALCEAGT
jgi:hypothetical protein